MQGSSIVYPHAARNFLDGYANTDYRLPLRESQLDFFYVTRWDRNSRLELLKRELAWGAERGLNTKFLLSGHVGCGKSTELNRAIQETANDPTLRETLFVVPFSVNEILDLQDVDYTDIAFSIVVAIYNRLQKLDITFPTHVVRAICDWIGSEVERFTLLTVGGEVVPGNEGGLPRLLSFLSHLGVKVRGTGLMGVEVRQKVKRRAPELRHLVNRLLSQLKSLSGMNVLLVIDDLDKLPKREALRVFRDDGPFLTLLECMAIYTAPISLMYELGNSPSLEHYRNYPVPMFKVRHNKYDEGYDEHDINMLCEVVYRRVSKELFEEGIVEAMVKATGGVIRHLVKMVQDSCLFCATFGRPAVDHDVLTWVIGEFKRDFSRRLGREDYVQLKRIHLARECDSSEQAWEYLQSLCVLEYVNGEYWYDVHPIVSLLIAEREPLPVG